MKNHLNIFEYYNQKGILPIENNSTRNLGLVLKNNELAFDRFLDLVSEKAEIQILKPCHEDEWFLKVQVKIKDFAKEDLVIDNFVGITLTTSKLEFYGNNEDESDVANITDIVMFSKGTLIIIEAKRNSTDATEQLKRQINQLKSEWQENGYLSDPEPNYCSLEWYNVIECLNNINILTNEKDVILNDYIEHIKNSVPAFFPVQTFDKLGENDNAHIRRRIERFALNYGTDLNIRNKSTEPVYWVKLQEKEYIKELAYQNYNNDLKLHFYPGNTIAQGYSLYNENNKLSFLKTTSLRVQNYDLKLMIRPCLKISDAWGKFKFDISVNTTEEDVIRKIFKEICGKRKSNDNFEILNKFEHFKNIISKGDFVEGFKENFKKPELNYTFIVSLTVGIFIPEMYSVLKKIDNVIPTLSSNDKIVEFTKEVTAKIYELIED